MYIMLSTGMAFVDKAAEFNTELFQVRPEGTSVVCCESQSSQCFLERFLAEGKPLFGRMPACARLPSYGVLN